MLDLMDTLNCLTVSGLRLRVGDDDTLSVVGDKKKLTPELKDALRQHKQTLVELHRPKLGDANEDGISDEALEDACQYFNRKESHTRAMTSPGFIGCVYCGEDCDNLIDGEIGIYCLTCDRYCWLDTKSGGLVRADYNDDLIEWDAPMDIDYSLIGKGHPALEKPLGIKRRWRRKK